MLIPGLFGSTFGFRNVIPGLEQAGYEVIVVEPLGIGTSARPERADYSLTAQAGRIAAVLPVRLLLGTALHQGGVPPDDIELLRGTLLSFGIDSVRGSGHYIFEEQPAAVVAAVEQIRAALAAPLNTKPQ